VPGVCTRCRIGIAPTGKSLCSVCVKRGATTPTTTKAARSKVTNRRDAVTKSHAVCPTCCTNLQLKPNGHFPRHTDSRTNDTCAGSGNYYTPPKEEKPPRPPWKPKMGNSVRTVPSGHPGSGRRR
jgi:hypothetical protein